MAYIYRNGKVYEQTISEVEVDVNAEAYKLQAWKDALANDARELQEYQTKIAEIDNLKIDEAYKTKLKEAVPLYSGSGIKQTMVDEHEAKLSEINSVVGAVDAEIKL